MAQLIYTFTDVPPGNTRSLYLKNVAKTSVHLFEVWARPLNTTFAGFQPAQYHFKAQVTAVETQGKQTDYILDTDDERVWIQVKNTGSVSATLDVYFAKL